MLSSLSHRNIVQFFGAVTVAPNYCIATGINVYVCKFDNDEYTPLSTDESVVY